MRKAILGVKCGGTPNQNGHDCNAALITNDKIVAIQAERIDRIKKSSGWKRGTKEWWDKDRNSEDYVGCKASIEYCLKEAQVSIEDVEKIVIEDLGDKEVQIREISSIFMDKKPIIRISHHLSHAASAYYVSPFSEATVIVVDGGGGGKLIGNDIQYERQSIYYAKNNTIEKIHTTYSTNKNIWGLGGAYAIHQQVLGLDAGKLMGLSAYGTSGFMDEIKIFDVSGIDVRVNSNIILDDDKENPNVRKDNNIYQIYRTYFDDPVKKPWCDIAYKIQTELEEAMIYLCRKAYEITKCTNLCIAGGVGLNSIINQKIVDRTPFKSIFIQPAADDSGIGLGCALYGYYGLDNTKHSHFAMNMPYWGREYCEEDILKAIEKEKEYIDFEKVRNPEYRAAIDLANKQIIGWFQGRSEYGPRALGNRSLLCDSRYVELRDKMNKKVKKREWWRPFAPSVLREKVSEYFYFEGNSPHMLRVAKAKPDKAEYIKGVLHVDNTARIQTVTKENNYKFYELIHKFYEITGIPMILNTSFNRNREPIVETPEDALNTFLDTPFIDKLYLENYIITRKNKEVRKI